MRILDRIFDRILDDVADRIASRIDDIHEARATAPTLAVVPNVDDDRYTALELDLIAARNRGGPHA